MAAALEAGVIAALPHRRRARHRGAGLRHGDRAARRQDRRPRQRLGRGGQGAGRARLRHRLLRRAERDRDRRRTPAAPTGSPPTWSRRPSTIPTRAPSSSRRASGWRTPCDARSRAQAAVEPDRAGVARDARRRSSSTRSVARGDRAGQRCAPEHLVVDTAAIAARIRDRRRGLRRRRGRRRPPATTPPARTTCCRPRRRPLPRRPDRRRLRPRHVRCRR